MITEVRVRGFIKIDGRCPSAIDDPKTAVADDTLSDRIREEGEKRCRFVLQSGIRGSEDLISGQAID